MSSRARVLWSEGMFLRTQHFQQHDRWVEGLLGGVGASLGGLAWGVRRLELDEGLLTQGKVALKACAGVLPDGTPFDIPDAAPQPEPIELRGIAQPLTVRLGLPVRLEGSVEIEPVEQPAAGARYRAREIEVRDANAGSEGRAALHIAEPRFRLFADNAPKDGYTTLAIARVLTAEANGALVLDREFVPCCVTIRPAPVLVSFLDELAGKLESIAAERAAFVAGKRVQGAGDIADFLILMLCNRVEPVARHMATQRTLHPEALYAWLLGLLGEASSFVPGELRPAKLPPYRHDEPGPAFLPLLQELRRVLLELARPERKAMPIPLKVYPSGVRAAEVQDLQLYATATFVLAFTAPVAPELIRQRLPGQIAVGPAEDLQSVVRAAVPGIPIRHLPTVPREIPLHRGMVYFELDRNNQYWPKLQSSAGLAFHVTGDLRDGMDMELWAIRD